MESVELEERERGLYSGKRYSRVIGREVRASFSISPSPIEAFTQTHLLHTLCPPVFKSVLSVRTRTFISESWWGKLWGERERRTAASSEWVLNVLKRVLLVVVVLLFLLSNCYHPLPPLSFHHSFRFSLPFSHSPSIPHFSQRSFPSPLFCESAGRGVKWMERKRGRMPKILASGGATLTSLLLILRHISFLLFFFSFFLPFYYFILFLLWLLFLSSFAPSHSMNSK